MQYLCSVGMTARLEYYGEIVRVQIRPILCFSQLNRLPICFVASDNDLEIVGIKFALQPIF